MNSSGKSLLHSPRVLFLGLALLFLAMRLLPVLTAVERVSHYDELDLGMIAREWLEGTDFPVWQYQIDPYGGESLVLAAAALPLVKLFGCTLFVIKMPSLLFAFLTFTLTFLFLKRFFGLSRAIAGALLLIFCPPAFVQFSLAALSGHAEVLALNMASFYFFYDFIFASRKSKSAFFFGLFSGLGFWFYQESAILTLTCLISWLVLDRASLFSRKTAAAALGLALGLLPLAFSVRHAASYTASFFSSALTLSFRNIIAVKEWSAEFLALTFKTLPASFAFFPAAGIHERVFSLVYFLALIVPVIFFLILKIRDSWRPGQNQDRLDTRKLLPILIFFPVFFKVFILSSFSAAHDIGYIGYRYLSPLHFFLLILPAVLFTGAKAGRAILGTLLFLGVLGQTGLMFQEPWGRALQYKGDSFFRVGTQWHYSLFPVIKSSADLADQLSRRPKESAFYLSWGLADAATGNQVNSLLEEKTRKVPFEEIAPLLPVSASPFLYEWLGVLQPAETLSLESVTLKYPAPFRPYLEKSMVENWFSNQYQENLKCPECVKTFHIQSRWFYLELGKQSFFKLESDPDAYSFLGDFKQEHVIKMLRTVRGLPFSAVQKELIFEGLALGHLRTSWDSNTLYTNSVQAVLKQLTPEEKKSFFRGLGWVTGSINREDKNRAQDWLKTFPEGYRAEGREGLNTFAEWYGNDRI